MNDFMKTHSRIVLVGATTLVSIIASLCIIFIAYKLMGVQVRRYEVIIGIAAPLLIASSICWYLYGLLKKLEQLEGELRQSISKEKEAIYLASIHSSQHVINNLLNQLKLVELEIEKHPEFDQEVTTLFEGMLAEADGLMKQLSSVKQIDVREIERSVSPRKSSR